MTSPVLRLAPGKPARAKRGHPWAFGNELEALPEGVVPGSVIPLTDERGRFLGQGIVNPKSQITWRRVTWAETPWSEENWGKLLMEALRRRSLLSDLDPKFHRLVWSESDGLPGLIVDRYEDVLVVQLLTLAMDQRKDLWQELLQKHFPDARIHFRRDNAIREKEGMARHTNETSDVSWFSLAGLQWGFPLEGGQKTGFYLDQLQQHLHVAKKYAAGARVLDLFSHTGGFAMRCASAGATSVRAVDISAEAVDLGRVIAERNSLTVDWVENNVFDYLSEEREGEYDLIILDPPNFVKSASALDGAIRGYKECHLRALSLLAPGGILATYCCSHHLSRSLFEEIAREAAADAGVSLEIVEEVSQSPDHPRLVEMPESEYFKGTIYRVRGRYPKPPPGSGKSKILPGKKRKSFRRS